MAKTKESLIPQPGEPPLLIPVPVFGATGLHWSGKTTLGLTIAPGVHPAGHAFTGQPRTYYLDCEMSGESYVGGTGAYRVNFPQEMLARFKGKQYRPRDQFLAFRELVSKIKAGQYDVIMVDPVTDIEDGLVEYVRENPAEFGYTSAQFDSAQALMWGAVKSLWKMVLADLSARCKIFFFVAHMRQEFRGGRPTGRVIPKGKDTLEELASLYVELFREPSSQEEKPRPPSANILKERLSRMDYDEATGDVKVTRILPDRLPECTPRAIRYYVRHPVGDRKLKSEELVKEATLSDDDRRMIELEIAQANERAATANLRTEESRAQKMLKAAELQKQRKIGTSVESAQGGSGAGVIDKSKPEKGEMIDEATIKGIISLAAQVFGDDNEKFVAQLRKTYGDHVTVVAQLNAAQAADLTSKLQGVLTKRATAKASATTTGNSSGAEAASTETKAKGDSCDGAAAAASEPTDKGSTGKDSTKQSSAASVPDDGRPCRDPAHGYCTQAQEERIKGLAERLKMPPSVMENYCKNRGCDKLSGLTFDEADSFLAQLIARELGLNKLKGATGKN